MTCFYATLYGKPDERGRQSFDLEWYQTWTLSKEHKPVRPGIWRRAQCFFAVFEEHRKDIEARGGCVVGCIIKDAL
jgi:hypothetical protein